LKVNKLIKELSAVAALIFATQTGIALAEDNSEEYFIEKHDAPGLYDDKFQLFANENGLHYLIERGDDDWYQSYFYKEVSEIIDLDGDGLNEAILRTQGTGNCCGPTYFIISKIQDGFYTISTHPELSGWPSIDIKQTNDLPELWISNFSDGVDNTSMEKTLAIMTFEKGSLHLIAKHKNSAQLSTLAQVTSKELKEIGDKILKVDLDHDGVEDQLRCSYWSRWGAASCNVVSSKFGEFNLSGGCNRLGVLDSSTAGMRDLVCNADTVLRFDLKGLKYNWP